MPFSRRSAVSSLLITALASTVAAKTALPDGVLSIPMIRIVNLTAYGIEYMVGTPPQRNVLKVDTGSPTMGFENPHSNVCQQSNDPCHQYGSYDNLTSSTAVFVEAPYRDILSNQASGAFINDTVRFSCISLTSFMFGTWDHIAANFFVSAPDVGILGLGQLCSTAACDDFPGFVQQLFDRGLVGSRAYSVYLGPDNPDAVGALLLNGVDRAKQDGPVYVIPMRDPTSEILTNATPNSVNYTSFTFTNSSGSFTVTAEQNGANGANGANGGFLDTGTSQFRVDQQTFLNVANYLGLTVTETFQQSYPVDCSFRERKDASITTTFAPGVSIEITMDRLVTLQEDGTCEIFIGGAGPLFGAPFLRNVYVVFDLDKREYHMSLAKYTDEMDIVAVHPKPKRQK